MRQTGLPVSLLQETSKVLWSVWYYTIPYRDQFCQLVCTCQFWHQMVVKTDSLHNVLLILLNNIRIVCYIHIYTHAACSSSPAWHGELWGYIWSQVAEEETPHSCGWHWGELAVAGTVTWILPYILVIIPLSNSSRQLDIHVSTVESITLE